MTGRRVAISQRFLPHYRLGFYRELVPRLCELGYELRLFHSFVIGDVPSQPWATPVKAWSLKLKVGELTDTAVFAPFVLPRIAHFRPDIVVLEDISNLPTSLIIALYCSLTKTPYLVWGLGSVPDKKSSRLRRFLGPLIRFFYQHAAGFVGYSRWAQEVYRPFGKPVYVAPNACLAKPTPEERARTLRLIEERTASPVCHILTIGELKQQKRIDLLLQALAIIKHLPIQLHVIGGGPQQTQLQQLATTLGLENLVKFYGAVYDPDRKKTIIENCSIGVLPGRGGLVIQEMMLHGLPVVCGSADGTERDRVIDHHNGFFIEGSVSAESLAAAIKTFMLASPKARQKYATCALDTVVDGYNIATMVDGFIRAIVETSKAQQL